ncbi:endolytic transglycosylase MltG [Candidatus Kaiserbacteria bacterium]|nr:endolytic transglycosylase MltG [Candidatus Kaiserbacteria bacterium]
MRAPFLYPSKKAVRFVPALRKAGGFLLLLAMIGAGVVSFGTRVLLSEVEQDLPATSFPVGIDPVRRMIVENPDAEAYFAQYGITDLSASARTGWVRRTLAALTHNGLYQMIASPTGRILVILPGERREEVAEHFGDILGWSRDERRAFMYAVASSSPELAEGKFLPRTYEVARGATPAEVAAVVSEQFEKDVLARYGTSTEAVVPLADTLTIASMLEREGKDFNDMRRISGIIWNRRFADMKLQIDATLQYARGSMAGEEWWPRVRSADKYIVSAYNTYRYVGLPPAPIANPSVDGILAALNPKATDCMFYFHDADETFHCTKTYEEHVVLLKQYYGRGK